MPTRAFTIQKLADAAGVGVEAVRYCQSRGLLSEPRRIDGAFRQYTPADVDRLRFIKRGQELGFSLDDIAELTSLSSDRNRTRVRELTRVRVAEIRERIAQLELMAAALEGLADTCSHASRGQSCPIIAALAAREIADDATPVRRVAPRANPPRLSRRSTKALEASQ